MKKPATRYRGCPHCLDGWVVLRRANGTSFAVRCACWFARFKPQPPPDRKTLAAGG